MSTPSTPPPVGNQSRTQALAALAPQNQGDQRGVMLSCGVMLLVFAVFMAICAGLEVTAAFVEKPGIALLSAVCASVLIVPYAVVILWLDRNESEPWYLLLTAFFWGAVMATGVSGCFNSIFGGIMQGITENMQVSQQLTASISAPFIEEITKGMALAAIWFFFKKDFDNVLDGIVYGAMVGLGFAAFENFSYYVNCTSYQDVLTLTYVRGIVAGVGSHACYTALTGMGVGIFRVMRQGCLRWVFPFLGLGLAMFVHFSWNTFAQLFIDPEAENLLDVASDIPMAGLVIHVPFVLFVGSVAFFTLWRESRMIHKYLSSENEPIVYPGEIKLLLPAARRSLHTWLLFATFRWGKWWMRRTRNATLIRLAFEKWHMDQEDQHKDLEAGHYHATQVIELRQKLSGDKPSDLP